LLGKTIADLCAPDHRVHHDAALAEIRRTGYARCDDITLQTRDGRPVTVEFVSNIYVEGDDQVIQCNVRDITQRKHSEQALHLLSTCVAHLNELLIITEAEPIDEPGPKIVFVNKAFEQLTGYRVEEVLGKSPRFLQGEKTDPLALSEIRQALAERRPIKHQFINYSKSGKEYWVEMELVPVFNAAGQCTHFAGIQRDVTEARKTESRLRRLMDSNVQGIFFWRDTGEITQANDAFLTLVGYSREDLEAGQVNWSVITPPEYADADRRALEQIAAQKICAPYEKEYIRKDGARVPILLGSALFEDSPSEGVCFVLDLTERKKLEHQFLRAQRMESIGTLAGGVAHDLNNILSPIMMAIEILKLSATDPQNKMILDTLETTAKRGADIVRQVLSFARGMEGERVEVQATHLLKDIESIVRDTFPKNIHLEINIAREVWTIVGDPTQLHQILLNLCVNARDAMPNGGNLAIAVENSLIDEHYAAMNIQAKPGRFVMISVTDTGVGIPADVIDKIFEPFFTTKEIGKGTGLGLSTVLAIVKSHDGFVNVYSEPGRGTTLKVYLPAIKVSPGALTRDTQRIELPRGNGETILVVDDESSVLTITCQTLEAFGYRVLTATDGAEAVAVYAARQGDIAAVLTDMMMPVMDGSALIRALLRLNPAVKIIAASGLKSNGAESKTGEYGAKHFLMKPYTARTLLKALRTVLHEP
jgi:PAS domain S-box-containing protein